MKNTDRDPDECPETTSLADVTVRDVRRAGLIGGLFLIVVALFLYMVREMLVAGILGAIIGAYLNPVQKRVVKLVRHRAVSALLIVAVLLIPPLSMTVYAYLEIRRTATYIDEHTSEIAVRIEEAIARIPYVDEPEDDWTIEPQLAQGARLALELPDEFGEFLGEFAVDVSVFLFTAFFVLTQPETILKYLRERVPARYAPLAARLEEHVHGALYGAVYGTFVTQTLKAILLLALNLVFGVPLAVTLALVAFIIGFFPIVGSWTLYIPIAGYLLIFKNAPWQAATMLIVGFGIGTILLSLIVRPKLASHQSKILDFYWMFIALVAGVYTFGVPGLVLGPIVVGLLKASFDTITADPELIDNVAGIKQAEIFDEDKIAEENSKTDTSAQAKSMEVEPHDDGDEPGDKA